MESMLCRAAHFEQSWYRKWAERLGDNAPPLSYFGPSFEPVFHKVWDAMKFDGFGRPQYYHRKMWEWCAIAETLDQAGKLRPHARGCGFAVGQEPLSSLFASFGTHILATDIGSDSVLEAWKNSGQHASSFQSLHWPNLISAEQLRSHVAFQPVDMRDLSALPKNSFDFIWSSCSLEHLGSLEAGLNFVETSSELLRAGGVAAHTTEFNVSSNQETWATGETVLYRRRDIEALVERLASRLVTVRTIEFEPGEHIFDHEYDFPPWYTHGRQHVKLKLGDFVATSLLLVCDKQG